MMYCLCDYMMYCLCVYMMYCLCVYMMYCLFVYFCIDFHFSGVFLVCGLVMNLGQLTHINSILLVNTNNRKLMYLKACTYVYGNCFMHIIHFCLSFLWRRQLVHANVLLRIYKPRDSKAVLKGVLEMM